MENTGTQYMLTTTDNPHDPFTQYDAWLAYDLVSGYDTNGHLARVVKSSHELSKADQELEILESMRTIVRNNVTAEYIIVKRGAVVLD